MADRYTPTEEQRAGYEEWCASRPPHVAEVARRLPPWKLYRMKSTGHRVTLYAFDENGEEGAVTLRVNVTKEYNFVTFERQVFGIDPDDLEECDLPGEDELLGTLYEGEEADRFIDEVARPAIMGPERAEEIRQEFEREREES